MAWQRPARTSSQGSSWGNAQAANCSFLKLHPANDPTKHIPLFQGSYITTSLAATPAKTTSDFACCSEYGQTPLRLDLSCQLSPAHQARCLIIFGKHLPDRKSTRLNS